MVEVHGRNPVIMLVDDEPMVTQALALFLELETEYEVITCISGAEALERLAAGPVDVVVSDFLMPGMTGLELLAEVGRRDPDIPRLSRKSGFLKVIGGRIAVEGQDFDLVQPAKGQP